MKWYVIEEYTNGDYTEKELSAQTEDEAIKEARAEWNACTRFEKERHKSFALVYADESKFGEEDFLDSVTKLIGRGYIAGVNG